MKTIKMNSILSNQKIKDLLINIFYKLKNKITNNYIIQNNLDKNRNKNELLILIFKKSFIIC